jgi:hypothetical protein
MLELALRHPIRAILGLVASASFLLLLAVLLDEQDGDLPRLHAPGPRR